MADLLGNIDGMADQALMRRHGADYGNVLKNQTALNALRSGSRGVDSDATRAALREASQEFEAVFINQLVAAMRKTVGESGLIEKSNAEKMFEGLLDEEWSRQLAGRHGQGGVSELIYRQLSRRMGLDEPQAASSTDPTQAAALGAASLKPAPLSPAAIGAIPLSAPRHPLLELPATPAPVVTKSDPR